MNVYLLQLFYCFENQSNILFATFDVYQFLTIAPNLTHKKLIEFYHFEIPDDLIKYTDSIDGMTYHFGGVGVAVDCPLLKGNQAPHLKFETPNGKITEYIYFFDLQFGSHQ